ADGSRDAVAGTVTIDPVTVQSMGVRTAIAREQSLSRIVRAPGRIDYDEGETNRLHPKTEGWIEELRIRTTGEYVEQDEILLSIYSPNLVTSQEEYLLTLQGLVNARRSGSDNAIERAQQLVRFSRERLELLDMPEHQIVELEQTRQVKRIVHIHSPFSGIVTNIGVREGKFVTPGTELFMISDLSRVWVYVDVFEHELPWIKVGDKTEMEVMAVPGRKYTGEIAFIYPYMEAKSRTVKVRMEFPNEEQLLKPEMFADVSIHADTQPRAVVVPSEAIVRSGLKEQVFVVRSEGKFEPRKVTPGLESEGVTQILSGINPGERVVTSAQFLIDSESRLNEATARMLKAGASEEVGNEAAPMHDMHDMHEMDGMEMENHATHPMSGSEAPGDER
ncbi:MAG: efflux RND transporter periplasmic adaptor subunit, partial [Pseudomonadales bacterium]